MEGGDPEGTGDGVLAACQGPLVYTGGYWTDGRECVSELWVNCVRPEGGYPSREAVQLVEPH